MLASALAVALAALLVKPVADRHRRFFEEEVHFLLSASERVRFEALGTTAERDAFVAAFWTRRDPTPGSSRNEAREAHEVRLAESDRSFGEMGRKGRFTERGRLYQLLGPPSFRESFVYAGHRLVPLELWHYTGVTVPFLPESFYLVLFRPDGQGPFQLWNPVSDGPSALVRTAGPEKSEAIARVDRELASVVEGGLVPGPRARSVALLADLDAFADLAAGERDVRATARAVAGFERLQVSLDAAVLRDELGVAELHYALAWDVEEGWHRARVVLSGRLLSGERELELERWGDEIVLDAPAPLDRRLLSFQGRRVVPPEATDVEISLARDGRAFAVERRELAPRGLLVVPRKGALRSSRFDRLPFHIGDRLLVPGPVPEGSAAIAVLEPGSAGAIGWELLEGERSLWSEMEDVREGEALLERSLPTENLPPGSYRVRAVAGDVYSETTFRIAAVATETRILARQPEAFETARYHAARARALVRAGRRELAVEEMAIATAAVPARVDLQLELAALRFAEGRCADVLQQLQPIEAESTDPDAFVFLAACSEKLGDAAGAEAYYRRALELAPADAGLESALERLRREN